MNVLTEEQISRIFACLKRGCGIRETARLTGINRNTVMRYRDQLFGQKKQKSSRNPRETALKIIKAVAESDPVQEHFLAGMCCSWCGLKVKNGQYGDRLEKAHLRIKDKRSRECIWIQARQLLRDVKKNQN